MNSLSFLGLVFGVIFFLLIIGHGLALIASDVLNFAFGRYAGSVSLLIAAVVVALTPQYMEGHFKDTGIPGLDFATLHLLSLLLTPVFLLMAGFQASMVARTTGR